MKWQSEKRSWILKRYFIHLRNKLSKNILMSFSIVSTNWKNTLCIKTKENLFWNLHFNRKRIYSIYYTDCFLPSKTPIDIIKMKGRRLPKLKWHLSLREPSIGVRKNPISGDKAHTRVICLCLTPILSKVGDTKAVSAAYENSIPITAAEIRTNSLRVFRLKESRK